MSDDNKEILKQQFTGLIDQYGKEYFAKLSSPESMSEDEIREILEKLRKDIVSRLPKQQQEELLRQTSGTLLDECIMERFLETSLKQDEEESREQKIKEDNLKEKFFNSVSPEKADTSDCFIGNWKPQYTQSSPSLQNNIPLSKKDCKEQIKKDAKTSAASVSALHIDRKIIKKRDILSVPRGQRNSLGFYAPEKNSITIYTSYPQKIKDLINQKKEETKTTNFTYEYMLGNPVAQNNVLLHETAHKDHHVMHNLSEVESYSISAGKANRLTETVSCSVEYLATAHQYTQMKKQGIKTIQINGKDCPLESILDMYDGLRETVEKYGFDVDNPKSRRRVVQTASDWWHKERQKNYDKQAEFSKAYSELDSELEDTPKTTSFSQLYRYVQSEQKLYDATAKKLLKNVYIGQNTEVDLTNCRDLLDTMTDADSYKLSLLHGSNCISMDELNEINKYLENIGMNTDAAKDQYMHNFVQNAVMRSPETDKSLQAIMLKYHNQIEYADGINATYHKDGRIYLQGDETDTMVFADETKRRLSPENITQNQTNAENNKTPVSAVSSNTVETATLIAAQKRGR